MVERRSPKPLVGGSSPSWPADAKGKFKEMIKKIQGFTSEVRAEMQKVTWATREELIGSTTVVLVTMAILSSFIGVTDLILSYVLSLILR